MKRYCITLKCDGEVAKRSKSDMCAKCQAGLRYWDDRDPADVMQHRTRLAMLRDRLGYLHAKPKRKSATRTSARRQPESRSEARAH